MYSDHQQIGHPYPHSSHHQGNEDQIRIVDPTEVPPEVMQPGNNYLKVQYILKQNVERNEMKEMFKDFIIHSETDEIACVEVIEIVKKLSTAEQEGVINQTVNYFLNAQSNLLKLDRLITKIFFALYEQKVMPILPIAYGLIKSLDMKFRITIEPKKVNFVREHLHEIGYKGMRDLLKLTLIDKLGSLPRIINESQRLQLIPVEDLMLDLLDRNRNLCPSLFVITEISRIHHNLRNVFILPRFSLAIRNFVASFRPVAEVGSILCRVWLYPITTTLNYSWFGNTWRVLEGNSRIPVKTHLPYTTEFLSAQSYFEYMILKQPRGQFNMNNMIKPLYKQPYQCNEMMQVLVLEAMKAMEETKMPVKSEVIQYNWRHIFHLVSYALCTNHGSFVALLECVKCNLDVLKFRRSRDELMWMILQYVALAASRQPAQPQIIITTIFEIFNHLYPDELGWTGSSSETWEMARFFAPASIWINLAMNKGDNQPPEKILSHVQYLEAAVNSKDMTSDGLLVVMANSYSNQKDVFETEICQPIYKRLHSSAGHQVPPYFLPYGLQADGVLTCLDSQFLEALTFHAKQSLCFHLVHNIQALVQNGRCPSPAVIETISRITLKAEAMNTHGRTLAVYLLNCLKPSEKRERAGIFTLILYDLILYRQKNAILSPNNRCLFVCCAHELMPAVGLPVSEQLPLYVLAEQAIIRQFMVALPYDLLPMASIFGPKNSNPENLNKFNLFAPPSKFFNQPDASSICPEVGKLLLIYVIMAYKFTADYPSEGSLTDFIKDMNASYKWPKCSLQWFPKNIAQTAQADVPGDDQLFAHYEELMENEQNALWHSTDPTHHSSRPPVTFITILNSMIKYPNMPFPQTTHRVIGSMSIMSLTRNINALVIYMIMKAKKISSDIEYEKMIMCLYKMIFVERYLSFERFFYHIILHPNDSDSIRASVVILNSLLTCEEKEEFQNNRGIVKRLHALYAFLPSNSNLLSYNSEEYFKKLLAYRKEYSNYDFERLSATNEFGGGETQDRGFRAQVPMYYSNIAERILPVVDILFLRCFEVAADKTVMETFLKTFAPIYRYHPQPITFLYKLAYILDGFLPSPTTNAKGIKEPSIFTRFVVAVCKKLDEDRKPHYPFLTPELMVQQHNMPALKFCETLVDRIVAATTYIHIPPAFVARDWRIAEFTPASQALISACLELMASPKDPAEIVPALVEVSMQRPLKRPYDRLNSVALILTNLPKRFQHKFFDQIADSFEWETLQMNGPDYLFSSYNVEVMQYSEDRIMSILALMHAFIQHANADTLAVLCTVMGERFAPKVDNETQLIYFLRIMTVYLLKISDRDKTNVMSDSSSQYLQLIISIYGMIPRILKEKPKLQYEDMVCDMLYLFKYTVMGYSVNKETEEAISRFPESMQKKLKFLPSNTMRDISNHHINKSIPHCTLIQLFDNNFQNIRDHSDLMPTAAMMQFQDTNQPSQSNIQQQNQPLQQNQVPTSNIPNQPMPIIQQSQIQQQPGMQTQQQMPPGMGPRIQGQQPQTSIPQPQSAQPGVGPPSYPFQNQPNMIPAGMRNPNQQQQQQFMAQNQMQNQQFLMQQHPTAAFHQHQQMMQQQMAAQNQPNLPQPPPYFAHANAGQRQQPGQPTSQQSGGSFDSPNFNYQNQQGHFVMQQQQMFPPGHPHNQSGQPQPNPQMMQNRPPYNNQGMPQGQMPPRMG